MQCGSSTAQEYGQGRVARVEDGVIWVIEEGVANWSYIYIDVAISQSLSDKPDVNKLNEASASIIVKEVTLV